VTMSANGKTAYDVEALRRRLESYGQGHLLRFWEELDQEGRNRLVESIERCDLELVSRLVKGEGVFDPSSLPLENLQSPDVWPLGREGPGITREEAKQEGEKLLREGRIACLVVAGGQGTRLGYPGPKGTLPFGPVSGASLFEIHCTKLQALGRKFGRTPPLLVLTSDANDSRTQEFFREHENFGLKDVRFVRQGSLPAVDDNGRIFLAARDQVFMSPDGHGGTLKALVRSGMLERLLTEGYRHLFYFQVDNPLVKIAEPFFLGAHSLKRSEYSLKVLRKKSAYEKLGVLVRTKDGRHYVVEYSDLPKGLAEATDQKGELRFWAGSPAIHVFDLLFFKRLADQSVSLPYHKARKKVPHVDDQGSRVVPERENGIKFEQFIFDVAPFARSVLAVEASRIEEFAPVKQKTGEDSLEAAQQALVKLHWSWLEQKGVQVPRDPAGRPARLCEIMPTFALGPEDLPDDIAQRLPAEGPVLLK